MQLFQQITIIVYIANLMLAAVLIFLERRNVGATWAWLMVLFFLPGLGFLLYLILGQNLSRRKIYKIKSEEFILFQQYVGKQKQLLKEHKLHLNDPNMIRYSDMMYMNLTSDYALYTQNNHVQIYTEGDDKFAHLLRCIEDAKEHIHLMYYIIRIDGLGRKVVEALTRKAREGVSVRVIYDDVGSPGLSKGLFKPLREAGGEVAAFFPSKIPYLNILLNFRNHRKLAIIDGKYGFIGGFNIGDEYLGLNKNVGYWRDTHLMVSGDAVRMMQTRFILDWNLSSKQPLSIPPFDAPLLHPARSLNQTAIIENQLMKDKQDDENTTGTVGMQIVSSGPNSERQQIHRGYLKMVHAAKKTIYLQTPYFIPDESLLTALRVAALSGVDVKVMFPGKPDRKIVYWASRTYLGELLQNGVRIYFYQKGFLHAKTIIVDDQVASVGTANIDIRSFKLNFETNAFIFDTNVAEKLSTIFHQDLQHCREMTLEEYNNRPITTRMQESLARLLSPIF